jgi:hypothetical protein
MRSTGPAARPGLTASTVSDPASERYHPNPFKKLAKVLLDVGMPGPASD